MLPLTGMGLGGFGGHINPKDKSALDDVETHQEAPQTVEIVEMDAVKCTQKYTH